MAGKSAGAGGRPDPELPPAESSGGPGQVLCLAPIELATEAERRLHRALSGFGHGVGVLGGLVVFVPVVDGAMQRRQADAVAFLPETVVAIRAIGMGRQGGELRPSATGAWTVGGEILRLSGGGSTPAAQLRKAVDLIRAALDSGGLDPGSPSELAAIDGPISSVRDRSAGGPVACSMNPGDVLTGLRHCANIGSQADTRVWTTADVKAALTIFGLQERGPSVEELNNEGFQYSPYMLRRPQSAASARTGVVPRINLLSGPVRPVTPAPAAEPGWDDEPVVASALGPINAASPGVGPRIDSEPDWEPEQITGPSLETESGSWPRPEDSGVGGLFGEPGDRRSSDRPAAPPQRTRPAVAKPRRRAAGQRSSRPAVLLGVVAMLAVAALAGLLYAVTSGLRADDSARPGTEAGSRSTTAELPTTPSVSSSAAPTQNVAGSAYAQEAFREDTDCAANAYGEVAEFFVTTPCTALTRALFTTTAGGAPVVISVSVVQMPDEASAAELQELAASSGTGNVSDLLRAGSQIEGGPSELVAAVYTSELSGAEVRIVEVAYVDPQSAAEEALLEAAARDALQLDLTEV